MSEEKPDQANETKTSLLEQFESLEIPKNIDPRLLELWLYREREELGSQDESVRKPIKAQGRRLTWLFAAYIGIVVMCLVIVLGLIQGKETNDILLFACQAFLLYTIIGFGVGWIAEYCVTDSVETLLREIVRRSNIPSDVGNTEPSEQVGTEAVP